MADVFDVATYILEQHGAMTAMKLQKLVYYSQAWSIAWDDDALFEEEIEAWQNGPVVRELWEAHRGRFRIAVLGKGNSQALSEDQKTTVGQVLKFYGDKSAQWLSDLTHLEDPWKNAWANEQSNIISKEALAEYYSSIEPPSEPQR
jgi:uncharacterized phage-associated protein